MYRWLVEIHKRWSATKNTLGEAKPSELAIIQCLDEQTILLGKRTYYALRCVELLVCHRWQCCNDVLQYNVQRLKQSTPTKNMSSRMHALLPATDLSWECFSMIGWHREKMDGEQKHLYSPGKLYRVRGTGSLNEHHKCSFLKADIGHDECHVTHIELCLCSPNLPPNGN